ncbi:protein chibby homolog 1 isoform X3 [Hippopotamus amphibius kiboko]|uniref:protein chibby homolog 1 isoform X3 n=2 Tax=Hippopotamus amphibius kiboko TaxID=575201 RepID=UPI00259A1BA3|nr:protein chibby homolog 1 isoform X3 [Hippopotamus amphibius kiboko]
MLVPTAVLPTTKLEAFWFVQVPKCCAPAQMPSPRLPKMPLFGSTFSPKKTPPRKSASLSNLHNLDRSTREVELGLDYGTPTMNLAGQSLKFENGQWIAETGIGGGVDRREAQRLRRRNQQLEEENNLLRLKVDILLDMLSETTAESHLMEKELDELKSVSRRRK